MLYQFLIALIFLSFEFNKSSTCPRSYESSVTKNDDSKLATIKNIVDTKSPTMPLAHFLNRIYKNTIINTFAIKGSNIDVQ